MKLNHKSLVLFYATLVFAGCAGDKAANLHKAEVGRGTFVSATGDAITAIYYANDTVRLHLPDKTEAELFSAVSASGARYTNNVAEWWEHQGNATYDIQGQNTFRGGSMSAK